MALNPITHQSAMEFTMSQSARSMMPNQSMSTLIRAFVIMSACGLAMPALGAGPTSGSRPFNPDRPEPVDRPTAAPKNLDQLLALPLRSGTIVISAKNPSAFQFEAPALIQALPNVSLVRVIDADLGVYELLADTTQDARAAYDILAPHDSIRSVRLDWDGSQVRNTLRTGHNTNRKRHQVSKNPLVLWPGVTPNPADESGPRGGVSTDPLFGSQWHFINGVNVGFDNNIPASVYATGLAGNGVQVAFSNLGINTHVDTDHTELDGGFRNALTMTFDPGLFSDSTIMTSLAGTLAGEIDAAGIQGIAPGVEFGNFNWPVVPSSFAGGIPLFEFEAFNWLMPEIDIKVYNMGATYYDDPVQDLNRGSTLDYVPVPYRNSFSFGRNRKGTINVFGTGSNPFAVDIIDGFFAPGWPDPYNFPPGGATWSPLDELFNQGGNASATTLTDDWTQPAFYPNAQVANYPPANDRRAFVFQTVAEDGFADIYAGQGPGVFASFFGGTTNRTQGGTPTNLLTSVPGASNVGFFPLNTETYPNESETMSGAMIGAGVIALMLEINPNLTIRDIQHIFFESIQESTKPANIKWPQFENTRLYLQNSFWQVNTGFYTGGPITEPQAIRHSDIFGFGVVDVELALQKAANWQRVPRLIRLDTGLVGSFSDDQIDTETEIEVEIADAVINTIIEPDGELGIDGISVITPGTPAGLPTICVRQNLNIEAITLELTIEGNGNEDLFIQISSPSGTSSVIKLPTTNNPIGVTPDGFPDNATAGEVVINGTAYALYRHSFLSWKHWGELSGGEWNIGFVDFGPDNTQHPEGELPDTNAMPPTPGADHILFMGAFGVPGSPNRTPKTVTGYRFEIFGTESGEPIFEGCNPLATSCPADLDGNGIIDYRDLQIFVYYFQEGNAIADVDGDGDIDYNDLLLFRGIWRPGFCEGGQFGNGRPRPGDTNAGGDNNPSTRPI